jgi:leucyl aminopeptidase (aminopeptidase T)
MKKLGLVFGLCVLGAGLVSAQPKPADKPAAADAALAERIVSKTANIKEGDLVEISTGPQDLAFAEDLAVAVRTKGAFPVITYWSESAAKKAVAAIPAKFDTQKPTLDTALAKLFTVRINLTAVRDTSIFTAMPTERRAAISKAYAAAGIGQLQQKRNVRNIELGNGMAPSAARATLIGLTEPQQNKMYWDGIAADYAGIEDKGKALKATLAAGNELRITMPNGTDLKMKVKARKVMVSDGVISDEDVKAGGPNVSVWLPAGEVYLTPVPGTAEGKLVDDRMIVDGKEITGITAEIKGGKITNITAKSGWDAVKGLYDAASPAKNEVSMLDFGINPAIKASAKFENFVAAGTVTVGTGNNIWAGGTNKEPFGFQFFLNGATVTLDGKPVVENGTLK